LPSSIPAIAMSLQLVVMRMLYYPVYAKPKGFAHSDGSGDR
jgi:hypothetical protein